jgi:16S rRNA processing protein RimM
MATKEQATGPYLAIGNIVGVHGIRGEVKVEVLTDYPERFNPGSTVYLGAATQGAARPAQIEAARAHKQAMLVKFAGVADRNGAEQLRGLLLMIPEAQAMPLGADENYIHDLIGLTVETTSGRVLGKLTEILATGANDVYAVSGPDGEILLPALREVVVRVDVPAGRMVVELPQGLLDE